MQRFLVELSKRNDLLLAFLLVSIIFMMILPLPTALVDVLIAINLTLTVVLLMAAVYLSDVTQLSAFPSILLLTTLFRLALVDHHHAADPAAGRCRPHRRDLRQVRGRRQPGRRRWWSS